AARARLGHGDGGDGLAGDHAGQVALLLLLAAVGNQIIGDDIALQRKAGGSAKISQFLADDGVEAEVEPRPTIGFRHTWAEKACGPGRFPRFALDDAFLLVAV